MRLPSLNVDADALARDAGSPRHCPHLRQAGQPRLYNQCLTCGTRVGKRVSAKPYSWAQVGSIPLFDEELRTSYLTAYFARYEARRIAEIDRLKAECRDEYQRYLKTPEWLAKRDLVLEREHRICQGCRSAPATQAHHTTYAHIGDEFLFELVAVCRTCHDRFHESEFPRFLDSLYFASYPSVEEAEQSEHPGASAALSK